MYCFRPILLVSLCCIMVHADQQQPVITLCPDIIAIIDGYSFGIHGGLVGAVYKIARDIQAMQLGKLTQQGRVGIYTFEGKLHTIQSLTVIEREIANALKTARDAERLKLEQRAGALADLLASMKQDFHKIVAPFMGQARGAKEPMFLLISESCTKRNHPKSLLLNWAHSSEDEMVSFDKSVTNFMLFDEFATDLVNFLGDLLQSCPKARAQFEKIKEDYVRKQAGGK